MTRMWEKEESGRKEKLVVGGRGGREEAAASDMGKYGKQICKSRLLLLFLFLREGFFLLAEQKWNLGQSRRNKHRLCSKILGEAMMREDSPKIARLGYE